MRAPRVRPRVDREAADGDERRAVDAAVARLATAGRRRRPAAPAACWLGPELRAVAIAVERGAQLGGREGQRVERDTRPPAAAAPRASTTGSQTPIVVQLVGAARAGRRRSVPSTTRRPVAVEHDDPVDEADGGVEVVLDEQDRAVARGDEVGEGGVDLVDALRVEVRRRLVEHEQRRSHRQRAGDRESLAAAAREPVGVLGRGAPTGRRGAARPRRARAPRRPAAAGSRGRTRTSSRTVPVTSCASGSWNTIATCVAQLRRPSRSAVSSPPTSTVPSTRPGTACGMRPLSASASVDLPEPLGPSSSTTSPACDVERHTRRGSRHPRPRA